MSYQSLSITDTPYKSATIVDLLRKKTRMDEVSAAVERDIKATLYKVPRDTFVETRIPSIDSLKQCVENLKADGKFTNDRWTEFPEAASRPDKSKEKDIYEPFASILNAIVRTIPQDEVRTKLRYVDRHETTPKPLQPDMPDARPDGAGAQTDSRIAALEEAIRKYKDTPPALNTRSGTMKHQEVLNQYAAQEQEALASYKLWWMYIHIVYEIKWDNTPTDRSKAVKQLLGYMRCILREQLDRRFVLGFVLLYDELTLVSYDRSGVMMTETAININTDLEMFVRVITGFSHMGPEELGWDTSMKIYRPPTDISVPSYEVAHEDLVVYRTNGRYRIPWVIDIEQDGKIQQYITVKVISAIRSAEVCSRATLVYEVIKFDEKEKPEKTYALKRYWKPIRPASHNPELYPSEGEIYKILDDGQPDADLKHAIVHHDIKVNGIFDGTFELIRRGMDAQRHQPAAKPRGSMRNETDDDAELRLDRRDLLEKSPVPDPDPSTVVLVERRHTNILMFMGQEIRAFSCLLELLYCTHDYVKELKVGHQKLIIHRDISMGNLFIFERDKKQTSFGRLMDYDHAKKASGWCEIPSKITSLESDRYLLKANLERNFGRKAVDDVLDTALKWHYPALASEYIRAVAKLSGLSDHASESPLTMKDLGWHNTEDKTKAHHWPDFTNRVAGPGERTGTLAYMSGEVINRAVLHEPAGMDERPPFVHEAIHDVESLLWVVVRLCLTRKGPGLNMRRDEELDEGSLKCNHKLRDLIIRLFDGEQEVLKKTKMDLHSHWKSFNDQVIVYFHPYFDPLKPFVLRWWNTLILGYKYRADEYYHIHDHILGIIDEAIECVKTIPDDEQARKAELKRRRKCKEHRLGTFSSKTPEMPPLSTSPSELEPLMRTPQQRHQSLEQDPDSPTAALSRKMRETHI